MEEFPYDPELNWTPEDSLEINHEEAGVLYLRWDNTTVYQYAVGGGKYDHIEHTKDDGETL